jgi:hypothetical protein
MRKNEGSSTVGFHGRGGLPSCPGCETKPNRSKTPTGYPTKKLTPSDVISSNKCSDHTVRIVLI